MTARGVGCSPDRAGPQTHCGPRAQKTADSQVELKLFQLSELGCTRPQAWLAARGHLAQDLVPLVQVVECPEPHQEPVHCEERAGALHASSWCRAGAADGGSFDRSSWSSVPDCVVVVQRTVESIIDILVPSISVPAVEVPTIVSLVVLVPQMDEGPVDVRKDVSRVSSCLEQTVDIRVPGGSSRDRVQQRTVDSSCA